MSSNKQQLEEKFYLLQDLLTDEFISNKTERGAFLLNAATTFKRQQHTRIAQAR